MLLSWNPDTLCALGAALDGLSKAAILNVPQEPCGGQNLDAVITPTVYSLVVCQLEILMNAERAESSLETVAWVHLAPVIGKISSDKTELDTGAVSVDVATGQVRKRILSLKQCQQGPCSDLIRIQVVEQKTLVTIKEHIGLVLTAELAAVLNSYMTESVVPVLGTFTSGSEQKSSLRSVVDVTIASLELHILSSINHLIPIVAVVAQSLQCDCAFGGDSLSQTKLLLQSAKATFRSKDSDTDDSDALQTEFAQVSLGLSYSAQDVTALSATIGQLNALCRVDGKDAANAGPWDFQLCVSQTARGYDCTVFINICFIWFSRLRSATCMITHDSLLTTAAHSLTVIVRSSLPHQIVSLTKDWFMCTPAPL